MSDVAQNKEGISSGVDIEWSYSGKAMRAQALLYVILSLVLIGIGIYATFYIRASQDLVGNLQKTDSLEKTDSPLTDPLLEEEETTELSEQKQIHSKSSNRLPPRIAWSIIAGCLVLLWGYYYALYFYRVYTIRYRLTERHLYCYRGLFTRTSDSMELIHINDVRLVQTLFDRIFNGGVGRLVIYCPQDKTDSELVLTGIDRPREIFEKIDSLRTALRTKRSILPSGA